MVNIYKVYKLPRDLREPGEESRGWKLSLLTLQMVRHRSSQEVERHFEGQSLYLFLFNFCISFLPVAVIKDNKNSLREEGLFWLTVPEAGKAD